MKSFALFLVLAVPLLFGQSHPIVFINGDNGVSGSGGSIAIGNMGASGTTVSKKDETTEMARTLLKSCREISVTVNQSNPPPDYSLLLYHEEGAFGGTDNQIMVLRPDKSVIFASKKGSVAKATNEGCKAIMTDWKDKRSHVTRESDPPQLTQKQNQ